MKPIIRYLSLALLSLFICGQTLAQTASLLPDAKQSFTDNNGSPLTSGTVTFYIPNTTTFKTTWKDAAQTILNTNPITLDASGRAIVYGVGSYRQVVKDRFGNLIWDQVTSAPGGGGVSGDSNPIATVLSFAGFTPPTNYVFAYGQELIRTSNADFLNAITVRFNVSCTSGSPSLTGIADTQQLAIGSKIESICAPTGATIISKTTNAVTMSANSGANANSTALFFPYGNGNGITTFNVPDYRGRALVGRDNMGGSSANRLTSAYFGNANGLGNSGGSQSHTLTIPQIPIITPSGSVTGTSAFYAQPTLVTGSTAVPQANDYAQGPFSVTSQAISAAFTGTPFGSGQAHNITQPSSTVNTIIKIFN